ncbi:class I adenylate-forming enzyme family protein [Nocardioides caricicola]|uniref:Class I adenylate-forming enzyme family protein n=1 Tax=Nocardioides caricicola TaxID=634770 RepID=A0ABW0N2C6_9ACTN
MTVPTYLPWHSRIAYDLRPCVADERRALTYSELAYEVEAVAEQLAEHGVDRGSVVALALPNQVELVVAMLAAWQLGAVAAPIDPSLTTLESDSQVAASEAAVVVATEDRSARHRRRVLTAAGLRRTRIGMRLPAPTTALDAPALIVHASDSVGRPQRVVLTHGNLAEMAKSLVAHLRITLEDHSLLVLPLAHSTAIGASFLAPLSVGGRVSMIGHDASAASVLDAVKRLRPTYFSGTATTFSTLASTLTSTLTSTLEERRADTSSLRVALCGGTTPAADVVAAGEEALGCPVVEGYGPIEGSGATTANPLDDRRPGTVGVALPGQEVAIMDPDGGLLPTGACGEVVVRSRTVMQGYVDDPEATALALGDGWLHTGDGGVLDEDGFLFLGARLRSGTGQRRDRW